MNLLVLRTFIRYWRDKNQSMKSSVKTDKRPKKCKRFNIVAGSGENIANSDNLRLAFLHFFFFIRRRKYSYWVKRRVRIVMHIHRRPRPVARIHPTLTVSVRRYASKTTGCLQRVLSVVDQTKSIDSTFD